MLLAQSNLRSTFFEANGVVSVVNCKEFNMESFYERNTRLTNMQLLCNSTEAPTECIIILIRHDIQT
jgi:hypothetical protein